MSKKQAGLIQLELLLIVVFLGVSASTLLPTQLSWKNAYHRLQLRTAATLIASDLRQLQSQVMFGHQNSQFQFRTDSDRSGYRIYHGAPEAVLLKRSFRSGFCSEIYFKSSTPLGFASSGSPSASGTLTLGHRNLEEAFINVELQPVTGRVLIHEN